MPTHPFCEFDISDDDVDVRCSITQFCPKGRPVLTFTSRCGTARVVMAGSWRSLERLVRAAGACLAARQAIEAIPLPVPAEAVIAIDPDDTGEFDTAAIAGAAEELPAGWRRDEEGWCRGPDNLRVFPSWNSPGTYRLAHGKPYGRLLDDYYPTERAAIDAAQALIAASQPQPTCLHCGGKMEEDGGRWRCRDCSGIIPARASCRVDDDDLFRSMASSFSPHHDRWDEGDPTPEEIAIGQANRPGEVP